MVEREVKNTHCTFTTQNAANNGWNCFSLLCTTKALSPQHHMAQAIKCVASHVFTPWPVQQTERPKKEKKERKKKLRKQLKSKKGLLKLILLLFPMLEQCTGCQCPHSNYATGRASHCQDHEFIMIDLRCKLTQNVKAYGATNQEYSLSPVWAITHRDAAILPTSICPDTLLACIVQTGMQCSGPVLHFEMWMEQGRAGNSRLARMGCGS